MDILKHPLCTSSIGAPADMPEPACSALPVAYREDEYGKWTVSFWQPSADELAQLLAGGAIALHVRASGRQHPVVALDVAPSKTAAPVTTTAKSFIAGVDALSDDDLWHIAGVVNALSSGSLLNVSQHDCVTEIRASFMDPDAGNEYRAANRLPTAGGAV